MDGPLVVVPEVIHWHIVNSIPMLPAVELVGKALLDRLPGLRVYLTVPRNYARLVTDEMVWQEGKPYRPPSLQPRSIARGFINPGHDRPRHELVHVPEQREVPRLAGARDLLLRCLNHWHRSARDPAALYETSVQKGMPAILLADAEEVFGFNQGWPKLSQVTRPTNETPGGVDLRAEALARAWKVVKAKGKDANWLPCHVEAVNKLRALEVPDAEIAREMGISRTRLQQECKTRSEAEAAATPGHAATAAAVQALAR